MINHLFLRYSEDSTNNEAFNELTLCLKPKILTIFKSINCPYSYKDLFIQECHIKIVDIVNKGLINEEKLKNNGLNHYFERAFKTVKQNFIRIYDLYSNQKSIDSEDEHGITLKERIQGELRYNDRKTEDIFKRIKSLISDADYQFLMLFLDVKNNEIRSVTEVTKLLKITHQAVSKRFKRIKKIINESITNYHHQ